MELKVGDVIYFKRQISTIREVLPNNKIVVNFWNFRTNNIEEVRYRINDKLIVFPKEIDFNVNYRNEDIICKELKKMHYRFRDMMKIYRKEDLIEYLLDDNNYVRWFAGMRLKRLER